MALVIQDVEDQKQQNHQSNSEERCTRVTGYQFGRHLLKG
jgi:hypothetical protein